MTNSPLVSIGLPVYNGDRFLAEALDSLLQQTWTNFELIISDNASTDGSEEICRLYAARDARVRYVRSAQNCGSAANFNRTFELATGKYFTWAAHDDLRAPEHIARCVEALERNASMILAYPQGYSIDADGNSVRELYAGPDLRHPLPSERLRQWFFAPHLPYHALFGLLRSSVLRKTSLLPNCAASDDILLTNLLLLGPFCEIGDPLFYHRDHAQRATRARQGADLALWCDPGNHGKVPTPVLRRAFSQFRALQSAPLSILEKLRCGSLLTRWSYWSAGDITAELVAVGGKCLAYLGTSRGSE